MAREITTVGVVGLGTMGAGIVEVFARNEIAVVGVDVDDAAVERGREHLETSTGRAVERGKLAPEAQEALLARVSFSSDFAALADCDLVVEAAPEQIEIKRAVFAELDAVVRPEAILATNTSSLSVTDIATSTREPARVVGMHFFNPAPVLKLVEVIRTVVTPDDVVDDVVALAGRLGKQPVVVGDRAGFIANALLLAYLNHAVSMFETKYASREDMDAAMHLGLGYPMGPLALLDLIGLDVAYAVLDTMYKQGRDRLHAPAPLLKQMITAGMLGRKTGRGFYTYAAPGSSKVVPDALTPAPDGDADAAPGLRIERVGIVGSGTMAVGIARAVAQGGLDVVLVARGKDKAAKAHSEITKTIQKAVLKGELPEDEGDAALARLSTSTRLDAFADCDLVVEAIAEELHLKQAMFESLDEICKPGAVFATTTSSLPVVECAAATSRPQDVIGLHFFNPDQESELVEVVSTVATDAKVQAAAMEWCRRIGKHPVACADRAGFIVNALLFPYLNDAIKMMAANYATADDIDTAMKLGCGLPMGPFELLDVIGLDAALAVQRELYLEFRASGYSPAPLLEHLVQAGYLGRKSGRGFRNHDA